MTLPMTRRPPALPLGSWAPLLCAVHCAATPFLVAIIPALRLGPGTERVTLLCSAVLAGTSVRRGLRVHHHRGPVLLLLLGLPLWGTAAFGAPLAAEWLAAAGALGVAGGSFWNARLLHRAAACRCGAVHPAGQ